MNDKCHKCGALLFGGKTILGEEHRCPPVWFVWEKDDGERDYALKVYAHDAERAAEKWAEQTASDRDYCMETVVCVASADDPEGHEEIRVYGEQDITWHADRIVRGVSDG